eukprot:SM000154S01420  [mRNA]  locus=s154:289822:291265:- [translate_table: standard]
MASAVPSTPHPADAPVDDDPLSHAPPGGSGGGGGGGAGLEGAAMRDAEPEPPREEALAEPLAAAGEAPSPPAGAAAGGAGGPAAAASSTLPGSRLSGVSNEEFYDAADNSLDEYSSDDDSMRSGARTQPWRDRSGSASGRRTESQQRAPGKEPLDRTSSELSDSTRTPVGAGTRHAQAGPAEPVSSAVYEEGSGRSTGAVESVIAADADASAAGVSFWPAGTSLEQQQGRGARGGTAIPGTGSGEDLAAMLAKKEREIARLKDKLQYIERMNDEMSQRNQELARARRWQRQLRSKLFNYLFGAALIAGVTGAGAFAIRTWAPEAVNWWKDAGAEPESATQTDHASNVRIREQD